MNIAITGSSGLVGSALLSSLRPTGHNPIPLLRPSQWDPNRGFADPAAFADVGAVVHLAGEPIASGRWTAARKRRILDSRVNGTRLIAETLARMQRPPQVLVSASAVGYYGDRGSELLREESTPGNGFLPDVCRQWEAATDAAAQKGIRIVHVRIGIVLSTQGGALQKMLPPFKLGLGGRIGNGKQFWSWISLADTSAAIAHCIQATEVRGAVNLVAPSAVTNQEFTRILARILNRPAVFPMPAFAARLAFGQMADELLLASARVEPAKLLASGFIFRHPELESAFRTCFRADEFLL